MKEAELQFALFHGIFEIESGWYNNHYYKTNDGGWSRASYPVPVISVKGYCDIEISFDRITVSTKMKRKTALAYSYDKIMKYDYEAYGVEDYLSDFYHAGLTVQELKNLSRNAPPFWRRRKNPKPPRNVSRKSAPKSNV